MPSPLARRLQRIKDEHRVSLRDIARKAGISEAAVLKVMSGHSKTMKRETLVKIAHAWGIEKVELLEVAGVLTEEDRWVMGRPTFEEFVKSAHLPLTRAQRQTLLDVYKSWGL